MISGIVFDNDSVLRGLYIITTSEVWKRSERVWILLELNFL
jgi:hypothetical protein